VSYGPYTRQQADRITRMFVAKLADVAEGLPGLEVAAGGVYESGNTAGESTGYCFDVTDGTHVFAVEVFGPEAETR
jgi:hypothetical protein